MTALVHFAIWAALARVIWAIGKARLGIKPRARRGRTVLELAAAGVAAVWLSRRADRRAAMQAQLIPPGSEVQVLIVPPKPDPSRYTYPDPRRR